MLHEIEGNLKSLEKQAKRTKRYFELKEEYKIVSLEAAKVQLGQFKDKYKGLKESIAETEDTLSGLNANIGQNEVGIEQAKKSNLDQEKLLSEKQKDLNDLINSLRDREGDKRMAADRKVMMETTIKRLTRDLERGDESIKETNAEIVVLNEKVGVSEAEYKQLEDERLRAEAALKDVRENHGQLKDELQAVIDKRQGLDREIFELEKNRAVFANTIDNLQGSIQRFTDELEQKQAQIKQFDSQLTIFEAQQGNMSDELKKVEELEREREEGLEKAREAFESIREQLNELDRSIDRDRNEFKLLNAMVQNLEGFPESIRFLSKDKSWGGAPLLSDIINVPKKYQAATEAFLDSFLNHFVVNTEAEVAQAVQLLADKDKGRAQFFVLDRLEQVVQADQSTFEAATALKSVVKTKSQYQVLVDHIMHGAYVAEGEMPSTIPAGVSLVSLDGSRIQFPARSVGGAVSQGSSKIGRLQRLEELEKLIEEQSRERTDLQYKLQKEKDKIDQLKHIEYRKQVNELQNRLTKVSRELLAFKTRRESAATNTKQLETNREENLAKIDELVTQGESLGSKLTNLREQQEEIQGSVSNTNAQFQDLSQNLDRASAAFNEAQIAAIRQQNAVKAIQQELKYKQSQLEQFENQQNQYKLNIQESETGIADLTTLIAKLSDELSSLYSTRKDKESALSKTEQVYFSARNSVTDLENKQREIQRKANQTQQRLGELKESFGEVRLQMNSIAERLRVEFETEVNDIINDPVAQEWQDKGEELLIDRMEKLRKRLGNYGDINPMAVEAYDTMNERYVSIVTQRDDTLNAKADLEQIITEIEETATHQFMSSFEQVRTNFKDVFTSLFTEDDTCDLLLEDPEQPLDSRIKIVAKPKGKRPLSINQLSGGEKTLTSTALLFSLYLLKPAPFCVFDEVDAPLDDANIDKFNRIIQKFSVDSQFIIVTHNKQTMAAVNTIFGVSMQEQGVSTVIPVDFSTLNSAA